MTDSQRLYRSESDRMLGGVCGGFAEVYDVDPTLVRLAIVAFTLAGGSGILLYLIAWLVIPSESEVKGKKVKDVEAEKVEEDEEE